MPATVKMQTTAVTQATTVTPETSNIKDDSNTLSLPLTTAGTQGIRIKTAAKKRDRWTSFTTIRGQYLSFATVERLLL
jgi:hypothetical protein